MSGRAAVPWGRGPSNHGERSFPMAMAGTVKFFNAEKGYGFIKPDDGGKDVFVHVTAVERAGVRHLAEGRRISFDTRRDTRGRSHTRAHAGKDVCVHWPAAALPGIGNLAEASRSSFDPEPDKRGKGPKAVN